MEMSKHPDLKFGPGVSTGFTPTGIAAFTNLRPAAVVRELIQNALDASSRSQRTNYLRTLPAHAEESQRNPRDPQLSQGSG